MSESTKFEGWAIVEFMGHVKAAGFVREELVFGEPLIRIDVPPTIDGGSDGQPGGERELGGRLDRRHGGGEPAADGIDHQPGNRGEFRTGDSDSRHGERDGQ